MRITARDRGLDLPLDQLSMLISGWQIGVGSGPGISDESPILYRPWSDAPGAFAA
jgi:hypothetical protein